MSKAIQTRYKGYRFRSRLEARWAVFLDSLAIPYHYEPEGFDLDGIPYLPDFYLPGQEPSSWLEIKPEIPKAAEAWRALVLRAAGLAKHRKEHVICILGDPFPGEYKLFFVGYDGPTGQIVVPRLGPFDGQVIVFAESDCGAIHLAHLDPATSETVVTIRIRNSTRPCPDPKACAMHVFTSAPGMSDACPDLYAALIRARQARFEHGESP